MADLVGSDSVVRDLMHALKTPKGFMIFTVYRSGKDRCIPCGLASEPETKATIKQIFEEDAYLLDPHTAVGVKVAKEYMAESGSETPCVVAATASHTSFRVTFWKHCRRKRHLMMRFLQAEKLAELSGAKVPEKISELKSKEIRHTGVIEKARCWTRFCRYIA